MPCNMKLKKIRPITKAFEEIHSPSGVEAAAPIVSRNGDQTKEKSCDSQHLRRSTKELSTLRRIHFRGSLSLRTLSLTASQSCHD